MYIHIYINMYVCVCVCVYVCVSVCIYVSYMLYIHIYIYIYTHIYIIYIHTCILYIHGYHHNIYQTLIKIKHNRVMIDKICPKILLLFSFHHASQVQLSTLERLGYMWLLHLQKCQIFFIFFFLNIIIYSIT